MKKKIVSLEKDYNGAVTRLEKVLKEGGVAVYPTDTLYGIGGNALDSKVVKRVLEIKKRPVDVALSVILGNLAMVGEYCILDDYDRMKLVHYFPGPYTLIFEARKDIPVVRNRRIGIRVSEHVLLRKMSFKLKMPIVSTSANFHGGKPPVSIQDIPKEILSDVDLVVDGGTTMYGECSTVIDMIKRKIVRQGAGKPIF
ncbi:threonylcarbamoyl-AMP synthase [Candidatus Micrarchaeota archaeon]|nr:threonylcarbamoyl-AMP synthase [Candidatus Micrarchaeota archaeon]